MKKEKKPLSVKAKLFWMKALKWIILVAPVGTTVGINWTKYAPVSLPAEEKMQLPIGLIIAFIIIAILIINPSEHKAKANDTTVLLIVFILTLALDPVIQDLKLLSGVALAGSVVNYLFITPKVNDLEETKKMKKSADINAQAMAEAQSSLVARQGRV